MKTANILIIYGFFLILAGLVGFLSNPEKAKTALMLGGTFGLIQIGVGFIARKGWKPAPGIGLGICAFLALTFTWRSIVSWMAFVGGQSEKLFAASLISVMLLASLAAIALLVRQKLV
jgi:hypothetical protein